MPIRNTVELRGHGGKDEFQLDLQGGAAQGRLEQQCQFQSRGYQEPASREGGTALGVSTISELRNQCGRDTRCHRARGPVHTIPPGELSTCLPAMTAHGYTKGTHRSV